MLKFNQCEVVSFDCYGTLIDWERGILPVLRQLLSSREIDLSDDATLELFAEFEDSEYNYIKYRKILQQVVQEFGKIFNFEPTEIEVKCLIESIKNWQPFPDTVAALAALKQKYKVAVISNIDDDLFADTAKHLKVELDWLITAKCERTNRQLATLK
jgi:2-haloacid dehalogenase